MFDAKIMLNRGEDTHSHKHTHTQNGLLCQYGEEQVGTPGIKPEQILSISHLSLWLSVASRHRSPKRAAVYDNHRSTGRRSLLEVDKNIPEEPTNHNRSTEGSEECDLHPKKPKCLSFWGNGRDQ